jgi:hypothetical protein
MFVSIFCANIVNCNCCLCNLWKAFLKYYNIRQLRKVSQVFVRLQWIGDVAVLESVRVDSGFRRLIPASSEGHEARDTAIAAFKVGQSLEHVCRSEKWSKRD